MRVFRFSFLISILFFLQFSVHAEKLTLPVLGFYTTIEEPLKMDFEWQDEWFLRSPSAYNHDLCRFSMLLSEVAFIDIVNFPEKNVIHSIYSKLGIPEENMEFDYDLDYNSIYGSNQSAVSFALKKLHTKQGEKDLVIVAVRGTSFNSTEWISNLNFSDSTQKEELNHEGYEKSALHLYSQLKFFLMNKKLDSKDTYFLITGHSRGAALINLLSYIIAGDTDFDTEKTFVYTFASPNVTTSKDFNDSRYDFIWNIINAEDVIQSFPPSLYPWKYRIYGQTKIFCNKWNTDPKIFMNEYVPKISSIYEKLRKRAIVPFGSGPFYAIQIDKVFTALYSGYSDYYKSPIAFRRLGALFFSLLLPKETDIRRVREQKIKNFWLLHFLLTKVCGTDSVYGQRIFLDMHLPESYLAYLMALDEKEAYSDVGSSQIILKGDYECAVFDKDGNLILNYFDGYSAIRSKDLPLATVNYPIETILGFPSTTDYDVLIYKDSFFPSPVKIQIEHYDGAGLLIDKTERDVFTTRKNKAFVYTAGEKTFKEQFIDETVLTGDDCISKITAGKIARDTPIFATEFSIGTKLKPEIGIHYGFETLYASAFAELTKHLPESFSVGVGHQSTLSKRIALNSEYLLNIKAKNRTEQQLRLYIGYKPFHSAQFFTAGVCNFETPKKLDTELKFGIRIQSPQKTITNKQKA